MSALPESLIDRARESHILEVALRCGAMLKRIAAHEWAGPCPVCGGRDRFAVNTRKQLFNCRGCGARGDAIAFVMHLEGCAFSEAIERLAGRPIEARPRPSPDDDVKTASVPSERDLASAARIVAEMRPLISEPIATAYLLDVRKIDVAAIEDVLSRTDAIGWHPEVYFDEPGHPLHGQRLGCIVGVMTDPITARPTGAISRTYLAPDRTKVGKAKTLGSPAGIVRLSPDDEVLAGLFLAEGLETALSGMARGLRPFWSTGSTAQMSKFPVLSGIEALSAIVDHDRNGAGEKAAREVEARWRAADREVNLFMPPASGDDLNDALRAIL